MLNRSINRDYDIPEHRQGILRCAENIVFHAESLYDVDYDPSYELQYVEQLCARLRKELSLS